MMKTKEIKNLDRLDKALSVLAPIALIALLLYALIADARAEQYSGAFIGQSTADTGDCSTASCQNIGFAYGVLHGYRFSGNWATEISYISHGEFSRSENVLHMSGSADTISISAVGFLPVSDQYELFARVGYGYQQKDLHADVAGRFSVHVEPKKRGFDFGTGVNVNITPRLSMRGSYDQYIDVDSLNLALVLGW